MMMMYDILSYINSLNAIRQTMQLGKRRKVSINMVLACILGTLGCMNHEEAVISGKQ